MTALIALIRKDAASDYGVGFPDFPGCVTAGRTLDEARRMAAEALELHVDLVAEIDRVTTNGSRIPADAARARLKAI